MGYIFLIIATLCGNAKGYAGKKSSEALDTLPSMLYFGACRTGMCTVFAFLICLFDGSLSQIGANALWISIFSGVSQSVFMLSWIAAVRGGAYVRLDVCCQAGMVIPCIFAAPLLNERVSLWQFVLLGALLVSIVLLSDKGKSGGVKMKPWDIILLVIVWIFSGTSSLAIKLYANVGEGSNSFFNFVTFAAAAISFSVAYLFFAKKGEKISLPRRHYTVYMPIMVAALYLNIFFQTEAAKQLDAMIMFPLQTVLTLAVSMLMAVALFGEKPTAKNLVGMAVAATAIILMNAA